MENNNKYYHNFINTVGKLEGSNVCVLQLSEIINASEENSATLLEIAEAIKTNKIKNIQIYNEFENIKKMQTVIPELLHDVSTKPKERSQYTINLVFDIALMPKPYDEFFRDLVKVYKFVISNNFKFLATFIISNDDNKIDIIQKAFVNGILKCIKDNTANNLNMIDNFEFIFYLSNNNTQYCSLQTDVLLFSEIPSQNIYVSGNNILYSETEDLYDILTYYALCDNFVKAHGIMMNNSILISKLQRQQIQK